jgi:dTDP-4-amino-4,6-dideoxygalactose transaminase
MMWPTLSKRRNTPTVNLGKCIFDCLTTDEDYSSELETKFANFYNQRFAVATASGRQAMELVLKSFNLSEGDEVIFPTLTFYILPSIVKNMGFKPVFVNCGDDFNIDVKELKQKISSKTKVIIATHIFGKPCKIDEIMKLAKINKIKVIEDCAHVQAIKYRGKFLGTFGDASFFSFQNRKPINAFGGGILITNSKEIEKTARETISKQKNSRFSIVPRFLLNYFELMMTNRYLYLFPLLWWKSEVYGKFVSNIYQKVHHENVDKRKKFSRLQARLALEQFNHIKETNSKRLSIAKNYFDQLGLLKEIELPKIKKGEHSFYSLITLSPKSEKLSKELFSAGVDVGTKQVILRNCGKIYDPKGDYKKTEELLNKMVELPMYRQLTKKDILHITDNVKRVLK